MKGGKVAIRFATTRQSNLPELAMVATARPSVDRAR